MEIFFIYISVKKKFLPFRGILKIKLKTQICKSKHFFLFVGGDKDSRINGKKLWNVRESRI